MNKYMYLYPHTHIYSLSPSPGQNGPWKTEQDSHGRTAADTHGWELSVFILRLAFYEEPPDPVHLVSLCPVTRIPGGFATVHEAKVNIGQWSA